MAGNSPNLLRKRRSFAANAAQFVIHPVIHVGDELPNRVRKPHDLARRQVGRKILDARYGIGVSAFTAEQFSERAGRHRV